MKRLWGKKGMGGTRVNLGPFSTTVRALPLWFGVASVAVEKLSGTVLGLGEAAVTAGGGAVGAGGVGLSALAQGSIVAKLGLSGLSEALGGNKKAIEALGPGARDLFDTLSEARATLKDDAAGGLFPGLNAGAKGALRNLPVLRGIVKGTAKELGGLAGRGGNLLGGAQFGRDFASIGKRNVRIIHNLGMGTLDLASAVRHLLVGAGPLAEWLSETARRGALLTEVWIANARHTGRLSAFFQRAKVDLQLLGSAAGHSGRGLINLFGAQDVDGTKTLAQFDRLTARFERWSNSAATRKGVGQALIDQLPKLAGPLASGLANLFGEAAPQAARIFWDGFWGASTRGKLAMAGFLALKTGAFGKGLKALGRGVGIGPSSGRGGGLGRSVGGPVPVFVTNPGFAGMPGGGGAAGAASKTGKLGTIAIKAAKVSVVAGVALGINEAVDAARKAVGYKASTPEQRAAARFGMRPHASAPSHETHVHVEIDRREIAKAVVHHQMLEQARRGG